MWLIIGLIIEIDVSPKRNLQIFEEYQLAHIILSLQYALGFWFFLKCIKIQVKDSFGPDDWNGDSNPAYFASSLTPC